MAAAAWDREIRWAAAGVRPGGVCPAMCAWLSQSLESLPSHFTDRKGAEARKDELSRKTHAGIV